VGQKLSSFTGVKTFVLRAFEDSLAGILNKRAVDVLHDVQVGTHGCVCVGGGPAAAVCWGVGDGSCSLRMWVKSGTGFVFVRGCRICFALGCF